MASLEPRYPTPGSTFLQFAEYTPWDVAVHLPSQGQNIPKSKPGVQANHSWSEPVSLNIEALSGGKPGKEFGNIRSELLSVDTKAAKAGDWKDPLGMSPRRRPKTQVSNIRRGLLSVDTKAAKAGGWWKDPVSMSPISPFSPISPTTAWGSDMSSPGMASDISWDDSASADIFEPARSPNPEAQAPETTDGADAQCLEESSGRTEENGTYKKSGKRPITTVMVQNLLGRLQQNDIARELDETGFAGLYDFLYMPRNFVTGKGRGYAFINFVTPEDARRFIDAWSKQKLFHVGNRLHVFEAHIQGLEANTKKWATPKMLRVKNADFRPLVLPILSGPEGQAQPPPEAAGSGLVAVTAGHATQKAQAAATAPAEP